MTVVHKKFLIVDIEQMQKAEIAVVGFVLHKQPNLNMYRVRCVLKSYLEKTKQGRNILEKIGQGDKMIELNMKYLEYEEAFTACIPVTEQTLNWNKYHVGGEIIIAYYPTDVWATFHTEGEPDNNNDKNRLINDGKQEEEDKE